MSEPWCRFLAWDSAFFGHQIFRVNTRRLGRESMKLLLEECRSLGVECLYFLADADDPETTGVAEEEGFRLTDIRVTLAWTADESCSLAPPTSIRPARLEDIRDLERIAATAYRDSRFFADPRFSRKAPSLYQIWIAKSVRGEADFALTAEVDGRPVGYITGHRDVDKAQEGRIGLVGVSSSSQGKGIGGALVRQGLASFVDLGIQRVEVVTQGRNAAAQRLYQRCGFFTAQVQLWFHKWFTSQAGDEEKP